MLHRKHFATNLRRLRHEAGLTHEELKRLSRVTGVAMYEAGMRTNPTAEMLLRLAKALRVDLAEFFERPSRK